MSVLLALIGFGEGLAVGGAFVALVTALRVVPRVVQVAGGRPAAYELALVLGAALAAADEARPLALHAGAWLVAVVGLLAGTFTGLLAAAIAEVSALLPLVGRRLGIGRWLLWLVLALALGKVVGAVLWWAVPGLWSRPPA